MATGFLQGYGLIRERIEFDGLLEVNVAMRNDTAFKGSNKIFANEADYALAA